MSQNFQAWLLIQDPPNPDLVNLVTQLGLFAKLDLTARPSVTLSLRDGCGVLTTADPDALFDLIWQKHLQSECVLGFSAAPLQDLIDLHGRTFFRKARYARLSCYAAGDGSLSDPYYRRLVKFEYEQAAPHGSSATPTTSVITEAPHDDYPLILNPQPLPMSATNVAMVFGSGALALQDINGVVLPPTRSPDETSYLAAPYHDVRKALSESLNLTKPNPCEPAMVSVWRLIDDPLLQDLLLDGGSLRLSEGDRQPTAARMEIRGTSEEPASIYRAGVFLDPPHMPGPPWATQVALALQADLQRTVSGGLHLCSALEPTNWNLGPLRPWQSGGSDDGTWGDVERLKDILPSQYQSERALVEGNVLNPSRRRAYSGTTENFPDNDLCERAFVSRFWRCPWSASTEGGPWRYALLDLLLTDWRTGPVTPEQRVRTWSSDRWLQLDKAGQPWVLEHPLTVGSSELLRWRLLLPLGVVFRKHGRVILNQISWLDRGYVLA